MDTRKSTKPEIGFISLETDDPKAMRMSARAMFKTHRSIKVIHVSGQENTETFERTSVNQHEGARINNQG